MVEKISHKAENIKKFLSDCFYWRTPYVRATNSCAVTGCNVNRLADHPADQLFNGISWHCFWRTSITRTICIFRLK